MLRTYSVKKKPTIEKNEASANRQIDWPTILLSGVVTIFSVFMGGLITMYVNISSKQLDYQYDYKKYILEKRQQAYNDIEKLLEIYDRDLTKAKVMKGYRPDSRDTTMMLFDNYRACLKDIRKSTFWWSREMQSNVRQVNKSILEIEYDTWPVVEEEAKFLGLVQYKFRPTHKALERTYFKDLMALDSIEVFKDTKRIDLDSPIDSIGVFDIDED